MEKWSFEKMPNVRTTNNQQFITHNTMIMVQDFICFCRKRYIWNNNLDMDDDDDDSDGGSGGSGNFQHPWLLWLVSICIIIYWSSLYYSILIHNAQITIHVRTYPLHSHQHIQTMINMAAIFIIVSFKIFVTLRWPFTLHGFDSQYGKW